MKSKNAKKYVTRNVNKNAEASAEKKRFSLTTVDKVLLSVVAMLAVAIIVVNVLSRFGLGLINGTVMMYLPLVSVLVLIGWGGYALIRRIRKPVVKTVVASVGVLVLLLGTILFVSYAAYVSYYTIPQKYATVKSPSGAKKLVVMRGFDIDSERSEARKAARLEADPEGSDELTPEDIIIVYRAYPEVWGVFYRLDADVEGEVCLAYAQPQSDDGESEDSGSKLMMDWEDDESAVRFYAQNPGVSEGGECVVRFK